MSFKRLTPLLLFSCLLLLAVPGEAQPPAPPPPEVTYITIAPKSMPVSFEFVGVTEASKMVEVRSRVRGFLESRDFQEGALVEQGTLLYHIDPRPFEADLQIAKARVAPGPGSPLPRGKRSKPHGVRQGARRHCPE